LRTPQGTTIADVLEDVVLAGFQQTVETVRTKTKLHELLQNFGICFDTKTV
jgi:hypothetical protein